MPEGIFMQSNAVMLFDADFSVLSSFFSCTDAV